MGVFRAFSVVLQPRIELEPYPYQLPMSLLGLSRGFQVLEIGPADAVREGHDPFRYDPVLPVELCLQGVPVSLVVFRVWSPVPGQIPEAVSFRRQP